MKYNLKKRGVASRIVAIMLVLVMIIAFSACGGEGSGSGGASAGGGSAPATNDAGSGDGSGEAPAASTSGNYRIGYLNFGPEWQLTDMMRQGRQAAIWANPANEQTWQEADGGYMADQMTTEIDRLLAGGIDALCYDAHFEPMLTDTIAKCQAADAALLLAYTPTFPERYEEIRAYEKFVGYFGDDLYQKGYQMGLQAAADGGTKAIIASGARGTIDMNNKIDGFTEGFSSAGGVVIDTITTTLPTEVEGRVADSLAANPDCDTIYGTVGAHCQGAREAAIKAGKDKDINFYSCDIDVELFNLVKTGEIRAVTTGTQCNWVMGMALLINFLDGHPILDENGQAPIIDWVTPIVVTQENFDEVKKYEFDNMPVTEKFFQSYLYAYNPDVTYQDFKDFADNYSIDFIKQKQEEFGELPA